MSYSVPNLFSPRASYVDSYDLERLQNSCCCINLDFFYLYLTSSILQRKEKSAILSTVQVFHSMIYSQMFLQNLNNDAARPKFDFSKKVHVLLLHKPGSTGIGLLVIRNYCEDHGVSFRATLFDFSEDSSFHTGWANHHQNLRA